MTVGNIKIPKHVAIIMDGNRRWAQSHNLETVDGHRAGIKSLKDCVMEANDLGVEYLTVYAFSTENWGRPQQEVSAIMELFSMVVINEAQELAKNNIRLRFIGDRDGLATELREKLEAAEVIEIERIEMTLVVAMNYSARWDIISAISKVVAQGKGDIQEVDFTSELSTHFLPDVDLLIRTSGEQRLSNFLLWESSYAELYFTETLWPDFGRDAFRGAVEWYSARDRRYGVRE